MSPVSSRHTSVDFDNPLACRPQSRLQHCASVDLRDNVPVAGRMNSCEAEAKVRNDAQVPSYVTVSVGGSDDVGYNTEGEAQEETTTTTGGETEWQTYLDEATNR